MEKIELRTENPSQGEIVIYQPDEVTRLEVKVEGETVWLTQDQIAILFGDWRSLQYVPFWNELPQMTKFI